MAVGEGPADRGDRALLHGQHDVVLQRLGVPLHEQPVGRQPGAADAEPGAAHDVLELVAHAPHALGGRDGVEVGAVAGLDDGPFVARQDARGRRLPEAPVVVGHHRHRLQQVHPGSQLCGLEGGLDRPGGRAQAQRPVVVLLVLDELPDLVQVGPHVRADEPSQVGVGQGLGPPHHRHAGREALQVPREVPEVGLVEVVDVEDEHPAAVHVGAEVLRVQVTLDPHPGRALVGPPVVGPPVLAPGQVGVEQTGRASIEGERVTRHAAEPAPERHRVGRHQVGERRHEGVDDERAALVGRGHAPGVPVRQQGRTAGATDRCVHSRPATGAGAVTAPPTAGERRARTRP